MTSPRRILPVASTAQVRQYAYRLIRRHPGTLGGAIGLQSLAALAGLAAPALLGTLVESISTGTTRGHVDRIALLIGGFVVAQAVLMRFAIFRQGRLGEQVLAELREDFVHRVLDIPLSTIERAGSGDLVTRTSRDVSALSNSVRSAVPETLIAIVTGTLTLVAIIVTAPILALPCLIAVPLLVVGTRWYLRRAPAGYLRESAAYAEMTDGFAETVDGARTMEALRIGQRRRDRTDADIARSYRTERYTLFLRTVWFPITEISYVLPVVATLMLGGVFALRGWVTIGQVTAATLYVQQLIDPLDRLLSWLDELQVGNASLARLLGAADVPADRTPTGATPDGQALVHDSDTPGLATGGSGDVLSGVIGGLLARGAPPLIAAGWGVWLHGAAGRAAAEEIGPVGFLARDLLRHLPRLLAV